MSDLALTAPADREPGPREYDAAVARRLMQQRRRNAEHGLPPRSGLLRQMRQRQAETRNDHPDLWGDDA